MNSFRNCVAVLISFFCLADLSASIDSKYDFEKYVDYCWVGSEEDLAFTMHLSDKFEFSDEYMIFMGETGQSCEVVCLPKEGCTVFVEEGREIKSIRIRTTVENTESLNKINAAIMMVTAYEGIDKEGIRVDGTFTIRRNTVVTNPSIQLDVEPEFFVSTDNHKIGCFVFTNLFGFSEMNYSE